MSSSIDFGHQQQVSFSNADNDSKDKNSTSNRTINRLNQVRKIVL